MWVEHLFKIAVINLIDSKIFVDDFGNKAIDRGLNLLISIHKPQICNFPILNVCILVCIQVGEDVVELAGVIHQISLSLSSIFVGALEHLTYFTCLF